MLLLIFFCLLTFFSSSIEDDSLAFNLYHTIENNKTNNEIFSPYSLKIALSMLSEGKHYF